MSNSLRDSLATYLQLSKTAAGRQKLLDSGEFSSLCTSALKALASWFNNYAGAPAAADDAGELLLLLRVLRNCCAAGSRGAAVIVNSHVHQSVAEFAADVAPQPTVSKQHGQQEPQLPSLPQQEPLLLAAVQMLANTCVAAEQQSLLVWKVLFPSKLQVILSTKQASVHEAVALMMLACLRSNSSVLDDLVSPAASSVWLQLLAPLILVETSAAAADKAAPGGSAAPSGDGAAAAARDAASAPVPTATGSDSLCLLVKAAALQHGRLQELMHCLQPDVDNTGGSSTSGSNGTACPLIQPNIAHAVLLHVVAAEVSALPVEAADASQPQPGQQQHHLTAKDCLPWLRYLVDLLKHLWTTVTSSDSGSRTTVAAHVLEATLQVLQAAVSREDAGRALSTLAGSSNNSGNSRAAAGSDCIEQLHVLGLVQLLLDMLKQLGAPPKRQQQGQGAQEQQAGHPQQVPVPPQPLQQQQQQPQQPYAGYRADLVATLSNFLHGRRVIQNEVLAAGGVEVLLNNCNLDDTAPLAREWALWSIRNMCQDNEDVQQYISQFQAVEAVQSKELDRMGMELHLDKMTNKLKLVENPKQQPKHQQ